ncbi:MAG: hypothetical protein ACRDVM_02230, partial [Acidimicrobiia bacterium]
AEPAPVTVGRTEYELGSTLVVPGVVVDGRDRVGSGEVAVVLIARADAVGREEDGTPAVIEHRTGPASRSLPFEQDLYAVGAALATRRPRVAVHTHHLERPDGPICDRTVYEEGDLDRAVERLRGAAQTIAAWHPYDALSPGYRVGGWCQGCPFERRCTSFRG